LGVDDGTLRRARGEGLTVQYTSTRRQSPAVPLTVALEQGLAPDGGLYVPARFPEISWRTLRGCERTLASIGEATLAPMFADDNLAAQLASICRSAFDLSAPLTLVDGSAEPLFALELFHGPTAAFKDFGARFLAECLERTAPTRARRLTILVATSGDTGGAVAAAFHRRSGLRVVVLFPKGRVSALQEKQLCCWDDNVQTLRVRGSFDDCQRLVKEAFMATDLTARHSLSSANSINLGRMLPQSVYYAASSLDVFERTGLRASYVIPSGNLGNACAAVWARQMGFPIDQIVLAHNANDTVPAYLVSGVWRPRLAVSTLATAMDVGDPSNMERLRYQFPDLRAMRRALSADAVNDDAIRGRISADYARYARIWCPHTATAAEIHARLNAAERRKPWVLVATAHPAKFADIVEPLLGFSIEMPDNLRRLLQMPARCMDIEPTLSALTRVLDKEAA
jgi:threonine synthase